MGNGRATDGRQKGDKEATDRQKMGDNLTTGDKQATKGRQTGKDTANDATGEQYGTKTMISSGSP